MWVGSSRPGEWASELTLFTKPTGCQHPSTLPSPLTADVKVLNQSAILNARLDLGTQTDLRPRIETVQWRFEHVNDNPKAYCQYTETPNLVVTDVNECKTEAVVTMTVLGNWSET